MFKPAARRHFVACTALTGLALLTACPSSSDDTTFDPDPQPEMDVITADDIGTPCIYDSVNDPDTNPTGDCANGLTCLIYTRNGAFTPYPASQVGAPVFLSVFEDQMTTYHPDGTDEGYCTLIYGDTAPVQDCPVGTWLRQFQGGFRACVKTCLDNNDCDANHVCDFRYLDMQLVNDANRNLGQCVRPCDADVPDCIRAGWVGTEADPNVYEFRVALEDLLGASICDETTGRCLNNLTNGDTPPGGACQQTEDCAGTVCLGAKYLGLPEGADGFCAGICPPNADDPFATCNAPGYACQGGLTAGLDPFTTKTLADNGDDTFGGWCFPACMTSPSECDAFGNEVACGQPDPNLFGAQWNQISMCMLPALLAGQ